MSVTFNKNPLSILRERIEAVSLVVVCGENVQNISTQNGGYNFREHGPVALGAVPSDEFPYPEHPVTLAYTSADVCEAGNGASCVFEVKHYALLSSYQQGVAIRAKYKQCKASGHRLILFVNSWSVMAELASSQRGEFFGPDALVVQLEKDNKSIRCAGSLWEDCWLNESAMRNAARFG